MPKFTIFCLAVAIVSILVAGGNFVFAWTPPQSAPPEDNVAAPINISNSPQAKEGALSVQSGGEAADVGFMVGDSSSGLSVGAGKNLIYGNMSADSAGSALLLQKNGEDLFRVNNDGSFSSTTPNASFSFGGVQGGLINNDINTSYFPYISWLKKVSSDPGVPLERAMYIGWGDRASRVIDIGLDNNYNLRVTGGDLTAVNGQICDINGCIGGGGGNNVWQQNGSDIFYTGGQVGIGTNDPRFDLHVEGQIRTTGRIVSSDSYVRGQDLYSEDDLDVSDDVRIGGQLCLLADAGGGVYYNCIDEWGDVGGGGTTTITGITDIEAESGSGLTASENNSTVTLGTDNNILQQRVSSECGNGSSIRKINQNGTVECEEDDVGGAGGGDNDWTISGSNIYRSSGNVGIGINSPEQKLDVNGNIKAQRFQGADIAYFVDPDNAGRSANLAGDVFATSFIDQDDDTYYIDPSLTDSPSARLAGDIYANQLVDSDNSFYFLNPSASFSAKLAGRVEMNELCIGDADCRSSWPENYWEKSGDNIYKLTGNIGIGRTPYYNLDVDGIIRTNDFVIGSRFYDVDNLSYRMDPNFTSILNVIKSSILVDLDDNNDYVDPSDNSYLTNVYADAFEVRSDKNLKKNINYIENALSKVINLDGVIFEWKNNEGDEHMGLIAQDVEHIIPEVVGMDNQGYKTIAYEELIPVLIEAIKEQQNQIEELKQENKELKEMLCGIEVFESFDYCR